MFIHTPAPQATPRVEPEFPLSLWICVRRDGPDGNRQRPSGSGCPQAAVPLHDKSLPEHGSAHLQLIETRALAKREEKTIDLGAQFCRGLARPTAGLGVGTLFHC